MTRPEEKALRAISFRTRVVKFWRMQISEGTKRGPYRVMPRQATPDFHDGRGLIRPESEKYWVSV